MNLFTCRMFALVFATAPFLAAGQLKAQDDVAHVKSESRKIEGDSKQRYFLIGPQQDEAPPAAGYGLIVVLAGGDGSAEFHPFVKRIFDQATPKGYLVAQPVAPQWSPQQQITWPTRKSRVPRMKFTTEEFVDKVITDVEQSHQLDPRRVFLLGWSSGGPASYAVTLDNPRVTGLLAAMSIFKKESLPPISNAEGRAFYVYHSDDDRVVPVRFAAAAANQLSEAGAHVKMTRYDGGHGWHGDMYGDIRTAIEWLEEQTTTGD